MPNPSTAAAHPEGGCGVGWRARAPPWQQARCHARTHATLSDGLTPSLAKPNIRIGSWWVNYG